MNVLVIPEDFVRDQYVLKPIIQAMLKNTGAPPANVRVCHDPRLGSVNQALRWDRISEIIDRYQMVDLFLLCIDRDGEIGRRASLDHLERQASERLRVGRAFFAENAWQEIEVWVLAGHDLPHEWVWRDIRDEVHPKEVYFDHFVRCRGLSDRTDGGRRILASEAARRYPRIRDRCAEDVVHLETQIKAWLGGQ